MKSKLNNKETVVLVHGIWMRGLELLYLAYKLKRQGYQVFIFSYPSLIKTPAQNAAALSRFIENIQAETVHLVAHSLGGIVLSHLFSNHDVKQAGKVVLIASPLKGSAVAKKVNTGFLKFLLGKSVQQGLLGDAPAWQTTRQTCIVAGTKAFGMGQLLARSVMQPPNDGTVNLPETELVQASEQHHFPKSHFLLLFSKETASSIYSFLKKE